MKKEIRLKASAFIKEEKDLIVKINKNPDNTQLKENFEQFRIRKNKWLNEIGGFVEGMTSAELEELGIKVYSAENEMSRAAERHADVAEYIENTAKNLRAPMSNYEVTIDDKSQRAAITEYSALEKIKALDNFRRKRNCKSFLNVMICKFKRPKSQEQSQESQGPNNG